MYKQINEKIQVLVSFVGNKIQPLVFRWGGKVYKVKKVHLIHINKEGQAKIYHFSVTDDSNYYKLSFHSEKLDWVLSEMHAN